MVAIQNLLVLRDCGKAAKLKFSKSLSAEAIPDLRRDLANNPENVVAIEAIAKVLRANGDYDEALVFFERLVAHRNADETANRVAPGSAAWQIDIVCLCWLANDHSRAVRSMHGLAAGILDGSIKYSSDAAGGLSQGLLLYYMAVSDGLTTEFSFALDYLRDRLKRSFSQIWPCPIAQYCLGDISFEAVMEAVDRPLSSPRIVDPDKVELGRRRRLLAALFYDGVKSREHGDGRHFLERMQECCELENPLIDQEWYLARYEASKQPRRVV